MTRTFVLLALFAAAFNAQECITPSTLFAQYDLVSQTAAIVTGSAVCKDYFTTNGACATPASTSAAMTAHNTWLAGKASEARNYSLQYINATVYWQTRNGVITSSTTVATDDSWWNNVLNTAKSWWSTISNRATSLFKSASQWVRDVFNNATAGIPACLQTWANVTNGAYCLAASKHSFLYKVDAAKNNDLSFAVGSTATGSALLSCEPLLDTYCQLSFGVSITNDNLAFNKTFSWGDNGLSLADCQTLRTLKKCGSTADCNTAYYAKYIDIFESYLVRFIPTQASINNFGTFLGNTNNAETAYTPISVAASTKKSFRIYVDPTTAKNADIIAIGRNSG